MINLKYNQRMGNNMFQYCFARVLTSELGYCLRSRPIEGFPNTYKTVEGLSFDNPIIGIKGHVVDIEKLKKDIGERGANIRLNGYFEYYPNLEKYRDQIRNDWLFLPCDKIRGKFAIRENNVFKNVEIKSIESDDLLLSVRLGDFLPRPNRLLTFDYFNIILSGIKFNRLFISSDSIEHEILKPFDIYIPIYFFQADRFDTLCLGKKFDKIAISRSSYSWWLAYLSDAKEIYFPVTKDGAWGGFFKNNIKVNEPRYIYVSYEDRCIVGNYQISSEKFIKS